MTRYPEVPDLSDDLYGELVDNLFGTFGAWLAAVVGSLTMASAGAYLDGRLCFKVCFAALALLSLVRAAVLFAYKCSASRHRKDDVAAMRRWERGYALPAIAWMAVIGLDAYFEMSAPSLLLRIFASVMAIGVAGGVAGRNASRPWIVIAQVTAVLAPYSVALVQIGTPPYLALLGMTAFTFLGVKSTTQSFHDLLVSAMTAARRNIVLAHRLDTALNNMTHGLIMFDAAFKTEVVNSRFEHLFAIAPGTLRRGMSLREVIETATRGRPRLSRTITEWEAVFVELMRAGREEAVAFQLTNGSILNFRAQPTATGGTVLVVEDITEQRRTAARIERMAHFDDLTGLPNRAMVTDLLGERCARLRRGEAAPFAVLYLDLDHFKQINDTLGHAAGDALLAMVSRRIAAELQSGDICGRLAGDEFVVVLPTADEVAVTLLADRLIRRISAPYHVDLQEIIVGLTIGIAGARAGVCAETLLKNADLALYKAKEHGRGTFCFFEPGMIREAEERRILEIELRHAIEHDDLDVAFQPIVDAATSRVLAYEALVRWHHPVRGTVYPDEFIRIAETTGLIVGLGACVLRKACLEATTWPSDVSVAVNLSAVQFRRGVVVEQIEEALRVSGLPAERLEIEITETVVLSNLASTREALEAIRALGVRVGLDDFGTGFSSLAYLQQIPFDKIKIDKSFVRGVVDDGMSQALIRLIASFVGTLDKVVVVEGVETAEQAAALRALGVGQMQGYFFGRPQPGALLELPRPLGAGSLGLAAQSSLRAVA